MQSTGRADEDAYAAAFHTRDASSFSNRQRGGLFAAAVLCFACGTFIGVGIGYQKALHQQDTAANPILQPHMGQRRDQLSRHADGRVRYGRSERSEARRTDERS